MRIVKEFMKIGPNEVCDKLIEEQETFSIYKVDIINIDKCYNKYFSFYNITVVYTSIRFTSTIYARPNVGVMALTHSSTFYMPSFFTQKLYKIQ